MSMSFFGPGPSVYLPLVIACQCSLLHSLIFVIGFAIAALPTAPAVTREGPPLDAPVWQLTPNTPPSIPIWPVMAPTLVKARHTCWAFSTRAEFQPVRNVAGLVVASSTARPRIFSG